MWNAKKPLTWPSEGTYATRPGVEVTKLGMRGNQAGTNKQYSAQSWRLLQLAVKHALYHSQPMLAFNGGLAHNLGAAWRRFFKIATRVQARGPGFEGCPVNAKPISNHGHGHSCNGCGARTAAGFEAVFESSDVERFGWILMEV